MLDETARFRRRCQGLLTLLIEPFFIRIGHIGSIVIREKRRLRARNYTALTAML